MPALVVDVKHLDRVVGEFRVGPRAAELSMRTTNNVDKFFGAKSRLSVQ